MKKVAIGAVVAAALFLPGVYALFALMSVITLSAGGASQSACYSPVGTVMPAGGPVRMPVTGAYKVTSEFGMRHNPGQINHGQYRLHAGIDLAPVAVGGPIVAASAGVVSSTPTSTGGGNMVVVDHGGGLVTKYLHLASRSVVTGDQVWAGRQLGVEGSTGNVSGEHLHFEVEVNGKPVDPRPWLTAQGLIVPAPGGSGLAPAVAEVAGDGEVGQVVGGQIGPAPLTPGGDLGLAQPVVSALPAQVGAWKGEQVTNAAYVIKAGQARSLDVWTITVAVMTAMAESSLTNVAHGDAVRADTIGLFQNGPERGPYEQRMDPTGAANIFYDYLLRVPGYHDLEPTIAAHKAQRNADPYHYESRWPDAVQMVATLTDDPQLLANLPAGGAVQGCQDGGPGEGPGPGDGTGAGIVAAAQHYLGTPYSWGGGDTTGPTTGIYSSASLDGTSTVGFDCSGLVIYAVHHATGITLPHSAEAQGKDSRGTPVPRDWAQLQPGDVISFSQDGSGAPGSFGHVGIYLGDGKMIHAPRPGKSVEVVQLQGSTYYEPMAWSILRYTTA